MWKSCDGLATVFAYLEESSSHLGVPWQRLLCLGVEMAVAVAHVFVVAATG